MVSIDEIMTRKPLALSEAHTVADAIQLMRDENIRHIPIVDAEERLVGLVTHRDVLAATDSSLRTQGERHDPSSVPLGQVMTRDVATVDEQVSLRNAGLYLERHKFGCLPVVADGKLVGIITDSDFVAVAINLLEHVDASEEVDEFAEDLSEE